MDRLNGLRYTRIAPYRDQRKSILLICMVLSRMFCCCVQGQRACILRTSSPRLATRVQ